MKKPCFHINKLLSISLFLIFSLLLEAAVAAATCSNGPCKVFAFFFSLSLFGLILLMISFSLLLLYYILLCFVIKVGDQCSSSEDCGDGLYCFSCIPTFFGGSKCVRSTYTNQFKLLVYILFIQF